MTSPSWIQQTFNAKAPDIRPDAPRGVCGTRRRPVRLPALQCGSWIGDRGRLGAAMERPVRCCAIGHYPLVWSVREVRTVDAWLEAITPEAKSSGRV